MPRRLCFDGQRLPASYANFYIANELVLVPTFNDPNDRIALNTLARVFPDRSDWNSCRRSGLGPGHAALHDATATCFHTIEISRRPSYPYAEIDAGLTLWLAATRPEPWFHSHRAADFDPRNRRDGGHLQRGGCRAAAFAALPRAGAPGLNF